MRMAYHFIAGQNQSHIEIWNFFLVLLNNLVDNFKFIKERNRFFLLVKETTRSVPQLNYEYILFEAGINVRLKKLSEERFIFPKTSDSRELVLEIFPNLMALHAAALCLSLKNLLPHMVIICLFVFFKVSHHCCRHISVLMFHIWKYFE